MRMIAYSVSHYVPIHDVPTVKTSTAIVNYSGSPVKFKMAVNSISWKMPSRFSFYSAKSRRKIRVKPYLIEFKRLLESSITAFEGVNGFSSTFASKNNQSFSLLRPMAIVYM